MCPDLFRLREPRTWRNPLELRSNLILIYRLRRSLCEIAFRRPVGLRILAEKLPMGAARTTKTDHRRVIHSDLLCSSSFLVRILMTQARNDSGVAEKVNVSIISLLVRREIWDPLMRIQWRLIGLVGSAPSRGNLGSGEEMLPSKLLGQMFIPWRLALAESAKNITVFFFL